MDITDNTAHQRSVTCTVRQEDMLRLVAEKVAEEAGFNINAPLGAKVRAYVSTSNRGSGSGSTEYNVRVELTQDLLPTAGPSRREFS